MLIEKIERLNNEKEKITNERTDLFKKTEEIHKRTQENLLLKGEIDKTRSGFSREKNRIVINKDREIDSLLRQLKYSVKFEAELKSEQKDKFFHQNKAKELQIEMNRLITVITFA